MLTALLEGVQTLETAIDVSRSAQSIDGALEIGGVPLDDLGALVGQPREGRDDASYARFIRARIAIQKSKGDVEGVYRIARALLPDRTTHTLEVEKHPPACFRLIVDGALEDLDEAADLAEFIQAGAKAGTRAFLVYSLLPAAGRFRFDSGPGFDEGTLAGEI
jgi:hypothetical protein